MREFFKSWRRKAGCISLAMACVFMAGWFRSNKFVDTLTFCRNPGRTAYAIQSSRQGICWSKEQQKLPGSLMNHKLFTSSAFSNGTVHSLDTRFESSKWRWRWWGFDFGENQYDQEKASQLGADYSPRVWIVWIIPYWSIVLPLTLLSACLLLGKSRSARTPIDEPDRPGIL